MAVKMRLTRLGDKKSPFYRIVVADSRVARDAKYIDLVGTYNPLTTPAEVKIDAEKATKWLANGAQPTETVKVLLTKAGITAEKKAEKKEEKKTTAKKTTTKKTK
ncbi:MAG: 30S ribosomal protein S16 [Clostridia bacterium]|nr:30S ribosomal protein S16 [Clostridia bacterium]